MTTTTKHKPCPFCGQEDDGMSLKCRTHPAVAVMASIKCHVCGMLGPMVYKDGNMDKWFVDEATERKAWAAWDTRKVKDGE